MPDLSLYLYIFIPSMVWLTVFAFIHPKPKAIIFSLTVTFINGLALAVLIKIFWIFYDRSVLPENSITVSDHILRNVLLSPLGEEVLKALMLVVIWRFAKIRSVLNGILFGLSLGLGFAASENLIYVLHLTPGASDLVLWHQAWYRSLQTPFLHAATSAIFGLCLSLPFANKDLAKRYLWPIGLSLAISAHAMWNLLGLLSQSRSVTESIYKTLMHFEILALFGLVSLIYLQMALRQHAQSKKHVIGKSLLGFTLSVGMLFGFYHLGLMRVVNTSQEYKTAVRYLTQSSGVKLWISLSQDQIKLTDVILTSQNHVPLVLLQFKIQNDATFKNVALTLIRLDDFLIVFDAHLKNAANEKTLMTSTYNSLLNYLDLWNAKKITACQTLLVELKNEIDSAPLATYLDMKQNHMEQRFENAKTLLDELIEKKVEPQFLFQYERAYILYDQSSFNEAAERLKNIAEQLQNNVDLRQNDDENDFKPTLPKDGFAQNFDERYILTKALALLSKTFYDLSNYNEGTLWAKEAIVMAENIQSQNLLNNALYLKAINLQANGDFKLASLVFDEIIQNPENPNLAQKAWAYFFKSETSLRENHHEETLNHLEMAINLDPKNPVIRQKAILYLIERNYPGDLEIALAYALRGINFDSSNETFVNLASQLYQRLEIPDKTAKTQ